MAIMFRCCNIEDAFLSEQDLLNRFVGQRLWIWGTNARAQLGDNSTVTKSSPVQTLSAGTNWASIDFDSGIKTDGTLWLWGSGITGGLGNNATTNRSSPVQTVSGGTDWKRVKSTADATQRISIALKTDGTLWTWGFAALGRLGNNATTNRSSPVQTVAGGTNWKEIGSASIAIKTDGTLWTWGAGVGGLLGDNTTVNKSSPVQTIGAANNWRKASGDSILPTRFNSGIKTDGTLWVWGCGLNGGLGNNGTTNRSSPVQTVAGGTNWKLVCSIHSVGSIKNDGRLWVWGLNANGQLGDNTITNKSSPVQTISGGTNWKDLSFSDVSMTAIKSDGTLWNSGQGLALGDNTSINKSSPVQTIAGGTNWRQAGPTRGLRLDGE